MRFSSFVCEKLNSVKLLKPNLTSLIAGQREISRLVNLLLEQSNSTSLVVWDRSKDVMAFHLHFNFSKSERTDTSSSGNLLFEHSNSFSLGFLDKSKDTSLFPLHTNFSKSGRADTSSSGNLLFEHSNSFSLGFLDKSKDTSSFPSHTNFSKSGRTDTSSLVSPLYEQSRSFSLEFLDKSKGVSTPLMESRVRFGKSARFPGNFVLPQYANSVNFRLAGRFRDERFLQEMETFFKFTKWERSILVMKLSLISSVSKFVVRAEKSS